MEKNTKIIEELLERGVEEVIVKENLKKKLLSKKKLRVKLGIDPTAPDLHLGHFVVLNKLRQFQELGHQIIFLIGDYTGMIGDPSGRSETRKMLTKEELKKNESDYVKQAAKVLDISKVEVRHNSEWYEKKGPGFMMELTSKFTFARLVERDDFKKRIENDEDVHMIELLYPLLQGYDSVELKADVEIGGTDQKFNLLTGRKVQKRYNLPEQDIITVPLLVGLDGIRKMSKSYDNYIAFNDTADEMFGKVMSLPDKLIWKYFELLTDKSESEISAMKGSVATNQTNPRDLKIDLAKNIIEIFYSIKEAEKARDNFIKLFQKKEIPENIEEYRVEKDIASLLEILSESGVAKSKSEARRLIEQGGVKVNGKVIRDWKAEIIAEKETVIQVGKRRFLKITK
jgi:tyrosyl-tRNA synthetase